MFRRLSSGFRAGRVILLIMATAFSPVIGTARDADTPGLPSTHTFSFDISTQTLEGALIAYGRIANVQVLYDANLVAGKRSQTVRGQLSAQQALDVLLRGTGLRARYAGANAITLALTASRSANDVISLDLMRVEARPVLHDSRRFMAYGQVLQENLIRALRDHPSTNGRNYDVTLNVWLSDSGLVERVSVTASTGDRKQDSAIAETLTGVATISTPPSDLPQPVSFQFHSHVPR